MIDYRLVGSRLKVAREAAQMTQEYVSEQIDISTVYLSKIENGKVHPSLERLERLCSFLHCDIGAVLSNVTVESNTYQNERIVHLFNACAPKVKPIALGVLEQLSHIQDTDS